MAACDLRGATGVRRYALLLCFLLLPAVGFAQNAPPILPAGDAAVAGFSGTAVVGTPPSEPQRVEKTYINIDGPALRVIGLSRMGGPPQAQLVAAPKIFTVTARQIGQVFSLALDDANPPNIYAAATSAYGLPVVVPDADGDGVPDRSRRGAPNAAFMPGLFGPIIADGGPGSIWKIDGRTGAVTLFANVTLGGVPNSGPALGALAFDSASRQLFVADRDTGMIHRFTLDGVDRGRFDHGVQALAASGLPPIAFDPRKRLNIESPEFDSGNPATWAYAPAARRVFGIAAYRSRLYYSVAAGLRIWSVSILPDGSFGNDARFEVSVPRSAAGGAEVSEILFDDNGDMLVAERGEPTGAYDYKALAQAGENRVLRFRPKRPDDPPSRDLWFPVPNEYAIGFLPNHRNDNGGIAIGYGYDAAGNINRAVCGGTLWSTGEQLRNARDPAVIQRLQPGGPLIVDGLQGNAVPLLRPQNEPPFAAYFIDYDDRFDDPQTRGHLGDVVIPRVCARAALPLIPAAIVCPAGQFNVDGVCWAGLACPPGTEFANGCCVYRGCPPSYARIRGRCVPPPMNCGPTAVYSNDLAPGHCEAPKCPPGLVVVQRKAALGGVLLPPPSGGGNGGILPRPPESNCPVGQVMINDQCQPSGGGCPPGQTRINDVCQPTGGMCVNYCGCPEGMRLREDGTCKPKDGCPEGTVPIGDGVCRPPSGCPEGTVSIGDGVCRPPGGCPEGTVPIGDGVCRPPGGDGPKLKVEKAIASCCNISNDGAQIAKCSFRVTVTNIGTTPYSGEVTWGDNDPNNLSPNGASHSAQVTLAPGQTQAIGEANQFYTPGTRYSNCVALGRRQPVNSGTPGPDLFCISGNVPVPTLQCSPPPDRGILTACPAGTRRGFGGLCFIVDPRPPGGGTSGCLGGVPRNSDGNCPPPQICTGGKIFDGNTCRCEAGKIESESGKCESPVTVQSKKPKKKKKTPPPSESQPQSSPGFSIGIGIGGGGRGGRGPPPRGNPGSGGGGKGSNPG